MKPQLLSFSFLILFFAFTALLNPALALPEKVRVRLFEAHPDLKAIVVLGSFYSSTQPTLSHGPIRITAVASNLSITRGGKLVLSAPRIVIGGSGSKSMALQVNGKIRHYTGTIDFRSASDAKTHAPVLLAINTVSIRDYVESSVGSELQPESPPEVAKAQAVMTQTILARCHAKDLLGDSTQRNVYLGADYIRPGIAEQVDAVWNQILTYKGRPAVPFWYSTCAGRTSSGTDIFGSAASGMPYLQSVKCEFCKGSPFWQATVTKIPQARFATVFGAELPQFHGTDDAQRPLAVSYRINGRKQMSTGYQFWTLLGQKFGWDKAPGLSFSLKQQGADIIVSSTGAGHGVGLCGWGAAQQAREGKTYREILRYYFPGTSVQTIGAKI